MEAKQAFGTGFGIALGCLVAIALFFVGGCVVFVTGVGWLASWGAQEIENAAPPPPALVESEPTPPTPEPVSPLDTLKVTWAKVVQHKGAGPVWIHLELSNEGESAVGFVGFEATVGPRRGYLFSNVLHYPIPTGESRKLILQAMEGTLSESKLIGGRTPEVVVLGAYWPDEELSLTREGSDGEVFERAMNPN